MDARYFQAYGLGALVDPLLFGVIQDIEKVRASVVSGICYTMSDMRGKSRDSKNIAIL